MSEKEEIELQYQLVVDSNNDINSKKKFLNFLIDKCKAVGLTVDEKNIIRHYQYKLSNRDSIFSFSILLEEVDPTNVSSLEQELQNHPNTKCLIKLKDDYAMETVHKLYEEIFDLEMSLREVLFIILLDSFPSNHWSGLLENVKSEVKPPELKISGPTKTDFLQKRLLNELFFLLFSQYRNLQESGDLRLEELVEIISNSREYEKMREKISNRGITNTDYQDFLAKIKPNLDIVEKFRNDIAHSRFADKEKIDSYSLARGKIFSAISDFKQKLEIQS